MAVGQIRFGTPFWDRLLTRFRTYFSGDWDVHWGYGVFTHGYMGDPVLLFLLGLVFELGVPWLVGWLFGWLVGWLVGCIPSITSLTSPGAAYWL